MVIGDLNLKSINWSTGTSENALETEFLNGFAELGLVQCIDAATHNKGNILDVLLTKSKHYISDIKIIDTERFCISDHYAIRFNIKHKVYRKPRTKRTCYNYKNACWEDLNNDLNTINWDSLLDFQEPEAAWNNFKNILFQKIDINVSKFTIKSEYQPPWFDSECYLKCKEKDKLHKTCKKKKTVASEIKFKAARRNVKSLIKSKMRANLDIENRNILTEKFWSYLKSTTKSTRIPEVVSSGTIEASEPIAKAKLFSEHFRKQFSESSSYEVELDFQHDSDFKIDFSVSRIKSILDALDTNKANGPDDISGSVLKNCSNSLSYPLSKIFHLSYNVGYIPSEWKT